MAREKDRVSPCFLRFVLQSPVLLCVDSARPRTQDASDHGSKRAASAASMGAADAAILRRIMPVRQQPHQGVRRRWLEHARARWTSHHRKVRLLLLLLVLLLLLRFRPSSALCICRKN